MTQTTIRLKLVDVLGKGLDDHSVVADIFDQHNINHYQVTIPLNGGTDVAISLQDAPGGVYRFELSPTNYQVIQFFLTLPPGGTVVRKKSIVFPVDADRVINISAPDFRQLDQKLQTFLNASSIMLNSTDRLNGEALYNSLQPKLKAALLNLFVKSSKTKVGQKTCFDFLSSHSMVELDQDRLFAKIDASLVEETGASADFRTADFSLHKDIPPYKRFASFKTLDAEGNLQLTFSRNGTTGNDYLVDMDIDEAQGIKHLFEVIQNIFAGLTNPYHVREILMAAQGIKPLYTFQFAQKKVARIAKAAGSRS
ncbi:MAG: hypothetical protein DMG65_13900 [Candidatus Angelobacter sp. Gp1-AA117]|nr:MAG: hypothetical protein DMG65_13900 [Candidatus Angelobacter sp. Gp1-AA117]